MVAALLVLSFLFLLAMVILTSTVSHAPLS
jgi:hypothetical protein